MLIVDWTCDITKLMSPIRSLLGSVGVGVCGVTLPLLSFVVDPLFLSLLALRANLIINMVVDEQI
jgi:hypothetical protein